MEQSADNNDSSASTAQPIKKKIYQKPDFYILDTDPNVNNSNKYNTLVHEATGHYVTRTQFPKQILFESKMNHRHFTVTSLSLAVGFVSHLVS